MFCYNFMEGITDGKEDFLLVVNLDFLLVHNKNNYSTKTKFMITKPKSKITFTIVIKLDIGNDNLAFDFFHIPSDIHVNIIPTRIKV